MQRVRGGLLRERKPLRNVRHAAAVLVGGTDGVTLQLDHLGPCGKTALAHRYRAHRVPRQVEIPSNVRERLAIPRPRNDVTTHRVGNLLRLHAELPMLRCMFGNPRTIWVTAATCKGCPGPARPAPEEVVGRCAGRAGPVGPETRWQPGGRTPRRPPSGRCPPGEIWLRLLPTRAIWRVRSRSAAGADAVHVRVRAIASRSSAEGDTPAAAAFSCQAACSVGVTRAATITVRRSVTDAPATGFGARSPAPARCSASGAKSQGVEGGRSHPLASRSVQHCVGWLTTSNGREPARRSRQKPPLRASPGTASTGPSRASSPASWSPASRTARTVPGRSCRAIVFRPTRNPSGTGDRRSQAIRRPVGSPRCPEMVLFLHRILKAQTEMWPGTGPPLADVTLMAVGPSEPVGIQ